ncbi:MAG: hypothetical protein M3288_01885 [Thermoproteota archaeon]|nr:hypothetical protein [Thermoproteota archaeon]
MTKPHSLAYDDSSSLLDISCIGYYASVFGIKIENSADVDGFTKLVNMTYTFQDQVNIFFPLEVDRKSSQMYVLSQDRNTGYVIYNNLNNTQTQQHSPAVQEAFNSFELVTSD